MAKLSEVPHALTTSKFFEGLNTSELKALVLKGNLVQYSEGDFVVKENDGGDELFCICAGKLEVMIQLGGPDPKSISFLGPGEVLGEMMLLQKNKRTASAIVRSSAELMRWYYKDCIDLFNVNPVLGYKIMHNLGMLLANRLEKTNLRIV